MSTTLPRTARTDHTDHTVWAPFRSLLGAQSASALLGLMFWVTVARVVPAHGVGVATAAISTQTLLGLFCSLGLGTFLVAELPGQTPARQRVLLVRALLVSAVAAVLTAAVVVALAVAAGLGGALGEALADPARAAVFVLGSVAAVWVAVLDEAVLGLRRSGVQVTRNLVASFVRFPLAAVLLLAGSRDALALQLCWVLPLLVSVAVAWRALHLPTTARPGPSLRADLGALHGPALHHYRLNLAVAACTQLVPVAAALTLDTRANAAFAVAWLLATFAFLPPYLLAVSLFAHGATAGQGPEALRATMRQTLLVALGLSLVICAGAWSLGRPVLAVFGGDYAEASYVVLALLVLAGAWMVVKDHLVALWRSEQRFELATRLAAVALVLELAGAATGGAVGGARGLAIGWLAAMALEALLLAPFVRRLVRPVAAGAVRGERGAATSRLALGVLLAVAGVAVGVLLVSAIVRAVGSDDDAQPDATSAAALELCRPTAEQPGPLVDLGVNTSTGLATHPHLRPRLVDALVASAAGAGADVVSTTVSWAALQPTATSAVDYRGLDRLLDAAEAHGLQVRLRLMHAPTWALDAPTGSIWQPPTTPAELRRWRAFVTAVAEHVRGRIAFLETWTEPDQEATWTTGPDPGAFARLLEATARAVRPVDPAVRLVSGGLAGNDVGYAQALAGVLGASRPIDLVGVHPYSDADPLTTDDLTRTEAFGAYDGAVDGYREVHAALPDLPVYIGEIGWSTDVVPDARRASYVGEVLALATCDPWVTTVSWYVLHPTRWDPAPWALTDRSGTPNATYRALQTWTRARSAVSPTGDPT